MLSRRSLLGCGVLALAGCVGRPNDTQTDPSYPPLSGNSEGWTNPRGSPAGTGRADTTLASPYDTEWLWKYDTKLSIPASKPQWYRSTPGVIATADSVVATAADLEHPPVAVDRTTPSLRWHLDELVDTRPQEFYRTPTPVAAGGELFVHTDNRCCRIAEDEVVWTDETGLWPGDTLLGDRSALYVTGPVARIDPRDGGTVDTARTREDGSVGGLAVGSDVAVQTLRFDADAAGAIIGYGPDWTVDWEISLDARPAHSSPAVHNGRAFVATERETVAVDLASGTVDWRSDDPSEGTGLGLDENGTVYVPHSEELLVALDATDGTRLWSAAADRSLSEMVGDHGYAPIVADDAVVLAGWDGLAILDRADGSLRWQADWDIVGAPAVAFGDLYAITADGVVAVRGN